ncbi:MAG: helix-turn-helix transcriptional regulator [Polaromonas sp.]|uniref:ArsR/SmtB family transcription factor n=1 Tax=Polaromonas sp. TaxID=1869339 RepID=UPI0018483175|nr:metalloregulator ArsR/SmtB family transcription factor [Polaromonas sp.]NMM08647.1 helix-turn-helix transcriptional regulator [Polaromonas sp.]
MEQQTTEALSLQVFERAAELFGLLSTPVRVRIVSALCRGEKNVTELRRLIGVAQPNISQHLTMLHRSRIVSKRRQGAQVFYSIADEFLGLVCRAVCSQVASETRDANLLG